MKNWKTVSAVLICFFMLVSGTSPSIAEDVEKAQSVHKKSHWWLIPVMAAGGFVAGVFLGLDVYDDAINSDQKVWTTAILLGAAGGVAGWLTARKIDQDYRVPGLGRIKPETRKPVPTIAQSTANHKKGSILSDIDRIYPSYLSLNPAPSPDYSVSPSKLEAKNMAANANSEYSAKNKISCSR